MELLLITYINSKGKIMRKYIFLFVGSALIYFFGAFSVQYKIFPYFQLIELKNLIKGTNNDHFRNPEYLRLTKLYKIYAQKQVDIVMLGDSITFGIDWSELFDKKIANRGIGSDTTKGFLGRMEQVYIINPKKVFIMGGINDISRRYSVETIFLNYSKIINELQQKNITPYVQSTLFTNRIDLNLKVKELNYLLKEFCNNNQIEYIDLNKKLSSKDILEEKYTYDGVHLNEEGYKIWKETIKNFIY